MTQQGAPNNKLAKGDRDENPRGIGLLALIREDLRTHDDNLLSPGFWALCVHRLGNARMGVKTAPLRAPLSVAYQVAFHGVIALWGIDLPYNVRVGRRLRWAQVRSTLVGALGRVCPGCRRRLGEWHRRLEWRQVQRRFSKQPARESAT